MQTAAKGVLAVIVASILAAPFVTLINRAINDYLDKHPEELPAAVYSTWHIIRMAALFVPSGLFLGIAIGAAIAFVMLRGWRRPGLSLSEQRRELLQNWREMAVRAQVEYDSLVKTEKDTDELSSLQRQPEYELFARMFSYESYRYTNSFRYRALRRIQKWRGKRDPGLLSEVKRGPYGLQWISLSPLVEHTMQQIAWLEQRWGLHKK